jgi:hypothetical protein
MSGQIMVAGAHRAAITVKSRGMAQEEEQETDQD